MKTILIATDFSEAADNACKYGIALAKEFKAEIYLLHAFQMMELDSMTGGAPLNYKYIYDSTSVELNKYVARMQRRNKEVKITPVLRAGDASSIVCSVAKEKKADLIVIGEKGKSFRRTVLFGSNAWRIVRDAPCMTLAVPHKARYRGVKNIAYATDMSAGNLSRVKRIIPIAKKNKAEITLLNINKSVSSSESKLTELTKKVRRQTGYKKISTATINHEEISEGISLFIRRQKSNWLVMFTRKKNIIDILTGTGSVTKKMIYYSSVPLLTLHERDTITRKKKSKPVKRTLKTISPSELTFNP